MEKAGEDAYRFNWDAPIIISKFDNKRIYFAANKLFRSDNRGNGWKVISPDLTANIDRNKLPVMGKVWSIDAVAKNQSTSIYGNITALTESPLTVTYQSALVIPEALIVRAGPPKVLLSCVPAYTL